MNTAIFSGSGGNIGIGFAIPSNMVKAVMTQLVQYGEVKRGMLGAAWNQFTPDIAQSLGLENARGALVSEVVEGGAADKAGIKAGDVITRSTAARSPTPEPRNSIGLLRIGDRVEIGLLREGKPRRVTAVIGERGDRRRRSGADPSGVRRRVVLERGRRPACWCKRSRRVARRSGGLRANDVILAIGRDRVTNVEQLRAR